MADQRKPLERPVWNRAQKRRVMKAIKASLPAKVRKAIRHGMRMKMEVK